MLKSIFSQYFVRFSLFAKIGLLLGYPGVREQTYTFHTKNQFFSALRKGLAKSIARELNVQDEELVVLKLVNRSRGAGVIIYPGEKNLTTSQFWQIIWEGIMHS